MITALMWWWCLEWLHLFRWLNLPSGKVKYFAFGANLDPKVLVVRGIRPFASRDFTLEDYEFSFSKQGLFKDQGYATVLPKKGARCYGKLYTLSRLDALRLDFYELVPFFRQHRRRWETRGEDTFYFYEATDPTDGLKPTFLYLGKILNGYKECAHVPPEYLEVMAAFEVLKEELPVTDRTFLVRIPKHCPAFLERWLRAYDRRVIRFMSTRLINKSLVRKFLKRPLT